MMGHVSVHDDDEVATSVLDAVDVCCSQSQLPCTRPQHLIVSFPSACAVQSRCEAQRTYDSLFAVDLLQLFGHFECPVR
jgi:hypothetical protein